MKLKIITILVLFTTMTAYGQNQRFIYQYQYAPDSLKPDSLKTEMMTLEVPQSGSRFFSKMKYDMDSIQRAEGARNHPQGSNVILASSKYRGDIHYEVDKTKNYNVFLLIHLDRLYKVHDDRPMRWEILPDRKQINNWAVQKASVSFAGRHWVAWFTAEIPIPDGPYKFHGLPGLIVEMNSADNTQQYLLVGIQKIPIKQDQVKSSFSLFEDSEKPIEITQKQYAKQVKKFKTDPNANLRQLVGAGGGVNRIIVNGKEVSAADFLHKLTEKGKEVRKPDNPLELKIE